MPTDKRTRQKQGRLERMEIERRAAERHARRRRLITGVGIAIVVLVILAFISLFGRDDGDDDQEVTADEGTSTTTSTDTSVPADAPIVTVPPEPLPTELQSADLTLGDGEEAALGDTIEVNYTGINASNGETFDSSFERGETAEFQLAEGSLIAGWTEGIPGMRVGGRRQLVIPPDLGYGETGQPPDIPANETLVFVIDLVSVTKAGSPAG